MANFFAELKRRHIYRVAAAYAVVAWVLLQLFNNVAPILELPPWVPRAFLLLLAMGFPIALLFAWMHQLAPTDSATLSASNGRLDWALMGALLVVIGLVSYQQLAPSFVASSTTPQTSGISIAVLPFANMSGDAGQEFFSDGMTEEITSALAKVQGLTVIGRTSAFEYKGQNHDLRAIGQALGVTHLIEGSVRKDGNRIRITAQLIRADNAAHLWAENYDRNLTDIFATQEDIAQAIAAALKVPLGLRDALVRDRTIDSESYQQYLQARALKRSLDNDRAIELLEAVVARNPNYAPAWASLSSAYRIAPTFTPVLRSGSFDEARKAIQIATEKAEVAAQKAISLDATLASGYSALASLRYGARKWAEANDLYRQAVALDPTDPEVLESYRFMLANAGYLSAAVRIGEQLQMLEPFVPIYNIHRAEMMQLTGANDESIRILEAVPLGTDMYSRNSDLARAYAVGGRFQDAADTLRGMRTSQVSRETVDAAAGIIGSAPAQASNPARLPAIDGSLNFVYAFVGANERTLERHERSLDIGSIASLYWLWDPLNASLRKSQTFRSIIRRTGLPEYWRAKGWPDLCRPVGTDDFACD
jgi:TolB-like protein